MSPEQLERFKQALIGAAEQYLAEGGKIVHGRFASSSGRCPMGCLLPEINLPMFITLTNRFGFPITDAEVWDFVYGFDGSRGLTDDETPTYLLGKELRARYIKE